MCNVIAAEGLISEDVRNVGDIFPENPNFVQNVEKNRGEFEMWKKYDDLPKIKVYVYDKRRRIFDKSDQITGNERGKKLAQNLITEIQKSRL